MDSDSQYLYKLEKISFQPIFILGIHRSGTSILYKMLTETNCFTSITAYHIINYNELLYNYINKREQTAKHALNIFFKKHKLLDRGIDRLQLSADSPEEYRFIFTRESMNPMMTNRNLALFREFCKKIKFISNNDKPLLLKNPFDFSNFLFIKNVFPEAKFIFIHRNPMNIITSNINSINHLFKKKNYYTALLSKTYANVTENLLLLYLIRFFLSSTTLMRCIRSIRQVVKITEYYLSNINILDHYDYINIRYEDLCEKPADVMCELSTFLKINLGDTNRYSEYIKPRKIKVLKELRHLRGYLTKKMHNYLAYFGYTEIIK